MEIESIYSKCLECNRVVIDSRKVESGDLFVAIKGDNHDANDFIDDVLDKGAKYIISDDSNKASQYDEVILVDDAIVSLQALALHHRLQLNIPIIGITGSNGKTTTKELCREVLSMSYNCYATVGNYNNHIGVPLSLLAINTNHELAIIEMGANHPGEIGFLCTICLPTHGVITNIGSAHLEGFGDLQGVINTKTELYKSIAEREGVVFYYELSEILPDLVPSSVEKVKYGKTVEVLESFPQLSLMLGNEKYTSGLVGTYNAINIACADKIGEYFGVPQDLRKKAIESYSSTINRSQLIRLGNTTVISDAYNANPVSMKSAIDSFNSIKGMKKTLVIGDMLELGNYSGDEHQTIIDYIDHYEYQNVFLIGKEFGKTNHSYTHYDNVAELKEKHPLETLDSDVLLLKGSRGIRLENYITE